MESIFWNVKGLKGAEKQLDLSSFLKTHKPSFVSLMDTKLEDSDLPLLNQKLTFLNSSFLSYDGRIGLFWNKDLVEVTIIGHSSQHVHCSVYRKSTQIYASNDYLERRILWSTITSLSAVVNGHPWIVGGDFNEVRFSNEKQGGRPIHEMKEAIAQDRLQRGYLRKH
ncbi:hypothetical protein QJS10_CPA09g00678 [Acorus calamus]|uniref:Endonuclease/exonuclease/phosphatase domain-containing protein n=1 Tax=Acorus calamus TaxID=4465 RepID=A0AAV9E5E6_ACOCL|nr:hypothetical protein QJS10_CPA09g00678 [Acorus calamus]